MVRGEWESLEDWMDADVDTQGCEREVSVILLMRYRFINTLCDYIGLHFLYDKIEGQNKLGLRCAKLRVSLDPKRFWVQKYFLGPKSLGSNKIFWVQTICTSVIKF